MNPKACGMLMKWPYLIAALMFFAHSASAREIAFVCTGSGGAATIFIDFDAMHARGFTAGEETMPATITRDKVSWRDRGSGVSYSLDRHAGSLTVVAGTAVYQRICERASDKPKIGPD